MTYLVDSDWIIDCLRGNQSASATLTRLRSDGLATSVICAAEIYEGAFGLDDPDTHLHGMRTFLGGFSVIEVNDAIAERFARIRAELRRRGQLIPDFDLLIGATALEHGLVVVTRNVRDFQRIPGLELYSG